MRWSVAASVHEARAAVLMAPSCLDSCFFLIAHDQYASLQLTWMMQQAHVVGGEDEHLLSLCVCERWVESVPE